MAGEQKREYPVRLDVSQQGAATPAPPTSGLRRAGAATGPVLATVAENLPVVLGVNALRRGMVASQGGAADFAEGLLGLSPGAIPRAAGTPLDPDRPAARAVVAPAAAAATQATTPASGGAGGRSVRNPAVTAAEPTPQDLLSGGVRAMLSGAFSVRDLKNAAQIAPAPGKSPTPKDNLTAQYGAVMQGLLERQQQAIAADLAAGKINAKDAAKAEESAVKEWQRNIGAVLYNPMNLSLAEQFQQQVED